MAEEETKKVSKNVEGLVDKIGELSVLELSDLVSALEDKFGVSAAAPTVAVAGAVAQDAGGGEEETKSTFDVMLDDVGAKKLQVIKEIRKVTDLGLKEAKDFVEGDLPAAVKEGLGKDEANEIKDVLETVGAKVSLK